MHPTHSGKAPDPSFKRRGGQVGPGWSHHIALVAAVVGEGLWIATLAWMAFAN